MNLKYQKGCFSLIIPKNTIQKYLDIHLSVISEEYQAYRHARDGDNYHITIIPSHEKPYKKYQDILQPYMNITQFDLLIMGLGKTETSYYLICHFPLGDKIRQQLDLKSANFHITLGFDTVDDHINPKNLNTLVQPCVTDMNQLLDYKSVNITKWSDILHDIIFNENYSSQLSQPLYEWWYAYITSCANLHKFDLVDTYLPILNELEPYLANYINLKIKHNLNTLTIEDINKSYSNIKEKNKEFDMKYYDIVIKLVEIMNHNIGFDSKQRYYIKDQQVCIINSPKNLTKIIIPSKYKEIKDKEIKAPELYGSAMISNNHLNYVTIMNYDLILNLTEYINRLNRDTPLISCHFPIVDRTPPTMEEMYKLLDIIDNKTKVIIHCVGGKGRTNTIIVAYLMWKYKMHLYEAMEIIKDRKVIISELQQEFLKLFEKEIITNEFKNQTMSNKTRIEENIDVMILIGLPCSGKSTFSQHLIKHCSNNIIYLNQDEMGRGKYEDTMIEVIKAKSNNVGNNIIILDRCNTTKEERKYVINLIKKSNRFVKIWGLWFDISIEELMSRAKNRRNHPVLSSKKVPEVIIEKNKTFDEPDILEGFNRLMHLKDEDQVNQLLSQWKLPTIDLYEKGFFKFPRTRHLHSLGSAERNDLLMTKTEQTTFLNDYIYIEEKVDGANMGISIDSSDYSIKIQNRSHYVNSASHQQFCKLDKWLSTYSSQLHEILKPDRYILFGEWLYMKHTVPYNNLPSYFVAFDLYDKTIGKFYARPQLELLLKDTGIPIVPLIYEGNVKNLKDILEHINNKSSYGNTQIEGLYCKVPDKDKKYYTYRGKIVRSDFILDDSKHWTHNTEPNELNMESYV